MDNYGIDVPVYLFGEGTNYEAYKLFSPTEYSEKGVRKWRFRVWAPNADCVSLVGDFNDWNIEASPLKKEQGGIWETSVEGLSQYDVYKYAVTKNGKTVLKSDPYGLHFETAPANGSKLYKLDGYKWKDTEWLKKRETVNPYESPMNIYEVHLGSWRRYADGNVFDYKKLADELVPYVKKLNYTHVELMPITEYPFDGSWGYQVTGMFAPTSRYGSPKDFMYFVDKCHKAGIGVILDFVLAHFPKDEHGLAMFDGTPCYEYANPKKGEHKEWGTKIFDYGKNEVKCFLISAVNFWFDKYHIDGIRCDAVASMLYLDYARKQGEWEPNCFGGNYNLEAKDFLQQLNSVILSRYKGAVTVAEESTAYPMVTKPPAVGGLGFNFKWNMGWMNDGLDYLKTDPFFRKGSHNKLTFGITYAYSENYILPLSHDEVVHGKLSLINRPPVAYDDKFENLKTFYGYMMSHPGKKLLFMGGEFGQFIEWRFAEQLDWLLLDYPKHKGLWNFVRDLNAFYLETPALYELDCSSEGFRWSSVDDAVQNVYSYVRFDKSGEPLLTVLNFSSVPREKYRMGVPEKGKYKAVFTSTLKKYGGSSDRKPCYASKKVPMHGFSQSITVNIPAYSVTYFKLSKPTSQSDDKHKEE